ncbi:hypothetical protein ACFL5O_12125, partial [Myxococcota bacterium]
MGALVAPGADVRLQAARPDGHRAAVFGRNVFLEPETRVQALPFDWAEIVGAGVHSDLPPGTPVHPMLSSPGDISVSVKGAEEGSATAFSD